MTKFEMLTKYIYLIKDDKFGDWIIDHKNDGTQENPIQFPFVAYTEIVHRFIDDVYEFEKSNKGMGLTHYGDILKENDIGWGSDSMRNSDIASLSGQCIMALIMGAVRAERFCDGALLSFFKDGCILAWLGRLKELDEAQG